MLKEEHDLWELTGIYSTIIEGIEIGIIEYWEEPYLKLSMNGYTLVCIFDPGHYWAGKPVEF